MSTETELTEEELRIWIAERCGEEIYWECPEHGQVPDDRVDVRQTCPWCGSLLKTGGPDYTRDLKAVREACLTLDIVSRRVFAERLEEICESTGPGDILGQKFHVQNATALQRARAFHAATK